MALLKKLFLKHFSSLVLGPILLAMTYGVCLLHLATLPKPTHLLAEKPDHSKSFLIHKSKYGIHQLVLNGSAYQRGRMTAELMAPIMRRQEQQLMSEFYKFFPNPFLRYSFILTAMRWFWGVDRYVDSTFLDQMFGLSSVGMREYNNLIDPYTRQLAYHGIHEIGQAFVDVEREDYGCTLFALKYKSSWLIGRNFDFEVGRIFDEEKTMQWHFPQDGYAYLSIIWAGMVGAVTGINEHGVYISINAAGSQDFRRYGTPTTLVVTKALQTSKTAEEAVELIKKETVFITDIFTVGDKDHIYKIEKSPRKTKVNKVLSNDVVTNHLSDPAFKEDKINQYRQTDLTTKLRYDRGKQLIESIDIMGDNPKQAESKLLDLLRDKRNSKGDMLHRGNRQAIDALIASHAVIYSPANNAIFVSEGPALVGAFRGFDLKKSFTSKKPEPIYSLPEDPGTSKKKFYQLKKLLKLTASAQKLIQNKQCNKANEALTEAQSLGIGHATLSRTLGDLYQCLGSKKQAKQFWQNALDLKPAYRKQISYLKKAMQQ